MPLNFISESNNEVKIRGWEAKCDQNTGAILVLEAPNTINHNVFVWFHVMIYDVSEASSRNTFEARWLGFWIPEACQQPTWSPDMRQDCVKTIGNITAEHATYFFQSIEFLEADLTHRWLWPSWLRPNISTLRPGLAEYAKLLTYKNN